MGVIAFIPVRGGSKSIPLKNIRPFCGRPLVYWTVKAACGVGLIDRVVISTDSDEIASIVQGFNFDKVSIFRRSAVSASDTASTEMAMIEYLQAADIKEEDVFILVQATSPMTESKHLEEALHLFFSDGMDSLLSCVRNKRFFWSDSGKSINYDYRNRPRRQDFSGQWMENGAFYISRVGSILKSGNRLSGQIGIYEMPECTSVEIDEPDDWMILENLMWRHKLVREKAVSIKLFLCDVDGTLTDGGMYYGESGDEYKKFNTRDGMGFQLLREAGIKTGIITSENTKIVENRSRKIRTDFLVQSKRDQGKLYAANEICEQIGISLSNVAYLGDDINCLDLLSSVGLAGCPADAQPEVKSLPGIHIMESKGGEGCAREFARLILGK